MKKRRWEMGKLGIGLKRSWDLSANVIIIITAGLTLWPWRWNMEWGRCRERNQRCIINSTNISPILIKIANLNLLSCSSSVPCHWFGPQGNLKSFWLLLMLGSNEPHTFKHTAMFIRNIFTICWMWMMSTVGLVCNMSCHHQFLARQPSHHLFHLTGDSTTCLIATFNLFFIRRRETPCIDVWL